MILPQNLLPHPLNARSSSEKKREQRKGENGQKWTKKREIKAKNSTPTTHREKMREKNGEKRGRCLGERAQPATAHSSTAQPATAHSSTTSQNPKTETSGSSLVALPDHNTRMVSENRESGSRKSRSFCTVCGQFYEVLSGSTKNFILGYL